MEKEKKFEGATAIKGKAKPTKKYLFRNKKFPGRPLKFFAGDAPKKCLKEDINKTCPNYTVNDGEIVKLPVHIAENLMERGIRKPINDIDEYGYLRPSGRFYLENRFELNEVAE